MSINFTTATNYIRSLDYSENSSFNFKDAISDFQKQSTVKHKFPFENIDPGKVPVTTMPVDDRIDYQDPNRPRGWAFMFEEGEIYFVDYHHDLKVAVGKD